MSVELVYHDFDDTSLGSPFEETLARLSDGASLDIACPYLGRDVLQSLTDRAQTWRLVTDVQEWFRSQPRENRKDMLEFLRSNRESIRDCRDLHAKVLVDNDAGLVGSANITYSGLAKNPEVAVLFEDTDEVDELATWFENLWERTQPTDVEDLRAFLTESEPIGREQRSSPSMAVTGPSIDASLEVLGETAIEVNEAAHRQLVETMGQAPSREWMDAYLDWVREVIQCTGLDESDERIATTVPSSSSRLPVNVNHRYVLSAFPKEGLVGIILPPDSSALDKLSEFISDFGSFSTNSDEDPYWMEFPGDPHEFITDDIKQDWREIVREESNKGSRSEYRGYHNSAVYKAAVDEQYRKSVLNSAFPS